LKKTKKISLVLVIASFFIFIIYLINKFIFFISTFKECLYSDNSKLYNWRFGKIFYTTKGAGSPLLLIHDLDCTSSDYEWKNLVSTLAENHTVYTIDLLGCGRSEKPKITYTNYLYVQLISDFIKNIIKHKTDVVVTGKSSSFVIMSCYIDAQLFNNLVIINPEDISTMNQYPKYKHNILKHVIDFPIIGTAIYNILVSKILIKDNFSTKYYSANTKVRSKYVNVYHESAHMGGPSAKYMYSSIRCHYTNTNIVHAIKELNNSIYIIAGENKLNNTKILEEYTNLNPSIESITLKNIKHLPQLENPQEVLEILNIFI
jgi:pimeloyl-ACP methyl ester carboxylesterase